MGDSAIKFRAGALLAVALALIRGASSFERGSEAGAVVFWIADRDGCAVYGLDEELVLARRVPVEWPTAVVGRPDGGAWVLRSASGTSTGPSSLLRLDSNGTILAEAHFSACAGLDSLGDGSAIVLENGSGEDEDDRVARCDEAGRVEIVYSGRALTSVACSKDSIAVGDARGVLVRVSLDPAGVVLGRVELHERISNLESDSSADHLWAITTSERATIHRLDDDFVVRWSAGGGSAATFFASDHDRDAIWVVDGPVVRRLDAHGVVELENSGLPIAGSSRAVDDSRGGLVIVSPGCVLLLDAAARLRPGQGGFTHLVDVDRVR